jgi:hypothetical protein
MQTRRCVVGIDSGSFFATFDSAHYWMLCFDWHFFRGEFGACIEGIITTLSSAGVATFFLRGICSGTFHVQYLLVVNRCF